jgi:putative heme iron utilization protein
MNTDHADTMRGYCQHFHQREVLDVAMLGIDCDGFDMRADGEILRVDFAEEVLDAQQARSALVGLAKASQHRTTDNV